MRSVVTWISCTGGYPTRPMATASASSLDAYRDEADRFIAALDEEYYLHYAGLKESFELEPIYERFSDLTTLEAARELAEHAEPEGAGEVELWHFACEGYLGNLTRAEAEAIAELEASLTVDRGRGGDPVPDAAPDDRERGRPRPARAPRGGSRRARRGAPVAELGRARREAPRGDARARGDDLPRAVRALRLPAGGARRAGARVPRRDRGAPRRRLRPASCAGASACRSRRRAATTSSARSAGASGTRASRPTAWCRRSSGRSTASAST